MLALIRAGAIDGLSIGFKTVRGRIDPKTRIRNLAEVELWEISIVTFPLLAGARVHSVKDGRLPPGPKPSFARTRAEDEWRAVMGGGGGVAPTRRAPVAVRGGVAQSPRRRAIA